MNDSPAPDPVPAVAHGASDVRELLRALLESDRAFGMDALAAGWPRSGASSALDPARPGRPDARAAANDAMGTGGRATTTAREAAAVRTPPGAFRPRVAPLRAQQGGSEQEAALAALAEEVRACTACKLHRHRTLAVPGEGHAGASLMFVGEGPGADEDRSGRPFVGRAGELLTRIIEAMGFTRETVFIANIVKCRPPQNRVPEPDETEACRSYLERQIDIIRPMVVCTLGAPATRALLSTREGITSLRGREFARGDHVVVPTFHPAYLLRNPAEKPKVWEDVQHVVRILQARGAAIPNPEALQRFQRP